MLRCRHVISQERMGWSTVDQLQTWWKSHYEAQHVTCDTYSVIGRFAGSRWDMAHSQRRQLFATSHSAGLRHRRRRAHIPHRCRLSPELERGDVSARSTMTTKTGHFISSSIGTGRAPLRTTEYTVSRQLVSSSRDAGGVLVSCACQQQFQYSGAGRWRSRNAPSVWPADVVRHGPTRSRRKHRAGNTLDLTYIVPCNASSVTSTTSHLAGSSTVHLSVSCPAPPNQRPLLKGLFVDVDVSTDQSWSDNRKQWAVSAADWWCWLW